jgi:heme A synthase
MSMRTLPALRRFSYAALFVAFTHLVFGAIVRISGSGMGCGDHWPLCYGRLFPPMDRPDLVVEWTHRLLASILLLTVATFAVVAWRARHEPRVGGRGGVLRAGLLALGAVLAAAILGAVTVKLGNTPYATVAHWLLAMTLFATLGAAAIRAGSLGGSAASVQQASPRVVRAANAAAVLAFLAVALGGLTAKLPNAAIACRSFPLCGADPDAGARAVHVQLAHRVLAILLLLHLIGVVAGLMRRREESRIVARAAGVALGLVIVQLTVAASMVLLHLPSFLRSLHEAVGVSVWLGTFTYAYLARVARGTAPVHVEVLARGARSRVAGSPAAEGPLA